MDDKVDIIVTAFDCDPQQAALALIRAFKLDAERAQRFVEKVPKVAKRNVDRSTAQRYSEALTSIGARVELRQSASSTGSAHPSSLPAPAKSFVARASESIRVERETNRAVARFRAIEGLDPPLSHPSHAGFDLYNPTIPKAPLIPKDLARMPNPALPAPSIPPQDAPGTSMDPPRMPDRPTYDAQRPPPPQLADSKPPQQAQGSASQGQTLPSAPRAFTLRTHWPLMLTAFLLLIGAAQFC